jgi:hypothetical protein
MILPIDTVIQNKYSRMKIVGWRDEGGDPTSEQDELYSYTCEVLEVTGPSTVSVHDIFNMRVDRMTDALASGSRRVISMGASTIKNPNALGNFPRKTKGEE